MTQNTIFDSEIVAPDPDLTKREATLVGFTDRYLRIHDQLRLLFQADQLSGWSRRFHRTDLPIAARVADQYPLVIFHGDVGTGKTAVAECAANRLLAESRSEESMIFRLSNRVRGSGKVGEMGTLLSEALKRVSVSAGRNRRAVLIIDEADSIAASRSQDQSHHEDKVAVNTLIQGIDDLRQFNGRVVVILCTNRLSVVDPALVRRAALIEEFARPSDAERAELLRMDLHGLFVSPANVGELVAITGPREGRPGWTFSDFRTRFYPAAVARAFPDRALDFAILKETASAIAPSRVMEDR